MFEKVKDNRLQGTTTLRQCQLTQLYLLDVLSEICLKHHLRYFLDSGTLLGAMRHNGFIPWDDDIDICMPEEDFRKFLKIAPAVLPDTILLCKHGDYPGAIGDCGGGARLSDLCSFYCEWKTIASIPSGIFIDIFPFGRFPELPKKFAIRLMKWYEVALFNEQAHRIRPNRNVLEMLYHAAKSYIWKWICRFTKLFYLLLCLTRRSIWNKRFGAVASSSAGFETEDIFPLGEHMFEGKPYPVPHNPEAYLTKMYGDWRTPPPPDVRGKHHLMLVTPTQAPNVWWGKPYIHNEVVKGAS